MPFVAPLPQLHPLHADRIRDALDDLREVLSAFPRGSDSFDNRASCEMEKLPQSIRAPLDPTWACLNGQVPPDYLPPYRTYVECLGVAIRRLDRAFGDANLTSIVQNDKAWEGGDAAEYAARVLLVAGSAGDRTLEEFLWSPVTLAPTDQTRWGDARTFERIVRAFADFREAVLDGLRSAGEVGNDRRPPPRLRVEGQTVLLDGRPVPLDMTSERREEALCYLRHLLEAAGDWRSDSEVNKTEERKPKGLVGIRWDHVRQQLPDCIADLIETHRRKGTRLKEEALRRG